MNAELLKQIGVGPATYSILKELGKAASQSGQYGADRFAAWREECQEIGLKDVGRTPAQEAFFDGWYEA